MIPSIGGPIGPSCRFRGENPVAVTASSKVVAAAAAAAAENGSAGVGAVGADDVGCGCTREDAESYLASRVAVAAVAAARGSVPRASESRSSPSHSPLYQLNWVARSLAPKCPRSSTLGEYCSHSVRSALSRSHPLLVYLSEG